MDCTLGKPVGQIVGSGLCTGRQSCHSEGPQQAAEVDWQTRDRVRQKKMQRVAPKTDS